MEMSKKNCKKNPLWNIMTDLVKNIIECYMEEFEENFSGQGNTKNTQFLLRINYCKEIWK